MTSPSTTSTRRRLFAATLASFALLVAACGGDPIPISVPASGESAAAPASQAPAAPVSVGESDLGDILVNSNGFSLYGFTDDVDGLSVCDGGCANAWPPVIVPTAELPSDLDPAVFSVIQRSDGSNQLKAGKWPLYLFAGDTAPGQTSGHLSGDVWFLAAPDGSLIGVEAPADAAAPADTSASEPEAAAAPATPTLASVAPSSLGDVLVSGAGLTLYGFTNDVDGVPTCEGGCAEAWPPILISDGGLPADLDPAIFTVVARPDGSNQLKAGKWPLYLFAGDTAPGQTTGHLSGGVWFAVSPTGGLIDGPAPTAPATDPADAQAQPEAAPQDDADDGAVDDGYGSGSAQPAPTAEPVAVQPTPVPPTPVPPTPVPPTPVPPAPAAPTPTPYGDSGDY